MVRLKFHLKMGFELHVTQNGQSHPFFGLEFDITVFFLWSGLSKNWKQIISGPCFIICWKQCETRVAITGNSDLTVLTSWLSQEKILSYEDQSLLSACLFRTRNFQSIYNAFKSLKRYLPVTFFEWNELFRNLCKKALVPLFLCFLHMI